MKPVVRHAESREQDAAKALAVAQQAHRDQQNKLTELRAYREEYREQLAGRGRGGISAAHFQQLRGFLQRLDLAVERQEQVVVQAARQCEERRRAWFQARSRTQALDKVRSRYLDEEAWLRDRQEQKDLDELAQRKAGNGSGTKGFS